MQNKTQKSSDSPGGMGFIMLIFVLWYAFLTFYFIYDKLASLHLPGYKLIITAVDLFILVVWVHVEAILYIVRSEARQNR